MSTDRIKSGVKKYAERLQRELHLAADRFMKAQDAAKNYLLATNPNGLTNGLEEANVEGFLTETEDHLRGLADLVGKAIKEEPWNKVAEATPAGEEHQEAVTED